MPYQKIMNFKVYGNISIGILHNGYTY